MLSVESELGLLRDPRLAAVATSAWPAWLWSTDASQILWANAAGAALFGAADTSACIQRRFDRTDPRAAQIIRLAATLPSAGSPRLERLRGFGTSFGRALTCACSRVPLPGGKTGVLVTATEPAGSALPLAERVRRLFPDDARPIAVFTPDGSLLHATEAARARLGASPGLSNLGLTATAAVALETGSASGALPAADADSNALIERLGDEASRVLVLILPPRAPEAASAVGIPSTASASGQVAAPEAKPAPSPSPSPASSAEEPPVERRHPLRFVWQMDADGPFVVGSDEFIDLVGPRTMAALGQKWSDAAAALMLDQDNQVTRAIATRETWSGIVISWPVDGTSERLPVELSGLPVFDRDRGYRGYRGFGVCRDIARINQLLRVRRERPIGFMPVPETAQALNGGAPVVEVRQRTAVPGQPATERSARPERPALTIAPAAANVLPFRQAPALEAKPPVLSAGERKAFRELAQELTARLRGMPDAPVAGESASDRALAEELLAPSQTPGALPSSPRTADPGVTEAPVNGDVNVGAEEGLAAPVVDTSLIDRIPIGVLVYRHDALIYANRHFLDWTGYDGVDALTAAGGLNSLFVEPAADVFSNNPAALSISIMTRQGDTLPIDGRLFTVSWNGAPAMALILTNGPAAERRRTAELALTTAETELRIAKRETQRAAAAKAEFLSKVSHELRTPLNSITGFAEVMLSERFGPIGNERYSEYLKNIHEAGTHLVSLINDMLDLSKVESGQLDLTLVNVSLNDLTQQCVGIMQPQANRARIIIRTSMTPGVPQVVVDERSLRQILINLLANAIKFTGPGGQVIVSTAISDSGEVILRVRDTGVGMTEKDIEATLEPYRQSATSGSWGSGGTGLGLPLTKALAEANRANFSIKSAPNAGTLVEVAFPRDRLAAN